jgi:hypothetical protein
MKSIKTLVAAFLLAGCAQTSSTGGARDEAAADGDWVSTIAEACPRCVPAKTGRENAPVSIPKRAVIYSFTGEFATRSRWWLINLDTGEITERESKQTQAGDWKAEIYHPGTVDAGALATLRASAVRLWRSKRPAIIGYAPGTDEEAYLISGERMIIFSRLTPDDRFFAVAVDAALHAADTDGSWTVRSKPQ